MANNSKKSKTNNKLVDGVDLVGHVARDNLERLGSFLDGLNAKSGKANQFKSVDLSNFESGNTKNIFSQQTLKASQQLIGTRFATYGKYAKKVVPNSVFDKVTDSAFAQVAKLAATWSDIDLPNEKRFSDIESLTDHERNALARDICNQNRALATLGSVTGLAGMPGLFADTLWLLLVSLRTVYQLATVYNNPLTGKEGVKMAYAVLSNADLSKMQEKQAILAGLGVAKGLLSNADQKGLRSELQNMGVGSSNVKYYAKQVDNIADQFNIDIDSMNLNWLLKLLPLSSVAVGVHYNSHLIDQVIGVAKATFGPEPITPKKTLANGSDAHSDKSLSEDGQSTDSHKSNDQTDSTMTSDKDIKDEVEDQFGEEPTAAEVTKGAETEESYEFNLDESESSNSSDTTNKDSAKK